MLLPKLHLFRSEKWNKSRILKHFHLSTSKKNLVAKNPQLRTINTDCNYELDENYRSKDKTNYLHVFLIFAAFIFLSYLIFDREMFIIAVILLLLWSMVFLTILKWDYLCIRLINLRASSYTTSSSVNTRRSTEEPWKNLEVQRKNEKLSPGIPNFSKVLFKHCFSFFLIWFWK